jgi:hypothetical protein
MPVFVASVNSFRVLISMPAGALMTRQAVSPAGMAVMAGPTKSGEPGVSMMLISLPAYSVWTRADWMECWCSFSSS